MVFKSCGPPFGKNSNCFSLVQALVDLVQALVALVQAHVDLVQALVALVQALPPQRGLIWVIKK